MYEDISETHSQSNTPPSGGEREPQTFGGRPFAAIDFTGQAGEYFGIWISNLLLTLLTFGIYDAWAKVRRICYFLNNTYIGNVAFVYHATGWQLFKGRLIVFAIFFVVAIAQAIFPLLTFVIIPIFLIAIPWVMNKSMRFNARMISWRNIRLDWHGTYWKTFFFLILGPVVGLLSLGTLLPLISRHYYRYYATNHSFGTTRFEASCKTGQFYRAFLVGGILPALLLLIPLGGIAAVLGVIAGGPTELGQAGIFQFLPLAFVITFFGVSSIYSTLCRNILLQSLTLGRDAEFNSSLNPWKLLWIHLSNFVVVVFSIGLMAPWAHVRIYRYLSKNTHYRFLTDEVQFVDKKRKEMSSFGEEFADWEGWEMSI